MPSRKSTAPSQSHSPLWPKIDEWLRAEIARRHPRPELVARTAAIAKIIEREFPDSRCALDYETPLQLVVATILSAQCTDDRVNKETPALFKKYRDARAFADAPPGELEQDIRRTGFFNNKAKAIREMSRGLIERFGGKVPAAMEDLLTLRGVARKTANVVRANAFGLPGITVDTHIIRLSERLKLTRESDPQKIEADIAALLPPEHYSHFSHALILHGRKTCKARKPDCPGCPINKLCPSAGKV